MVPIRLFIFHLSTKFGAKMFIDGQIMAQNRNSRWRPSAILELLRRHFGPPTESFHWDTLPVKFYANLIHSFEDMVIDFFLQNWLFAPKISVLGVWTPKRK